MENKKKHCTFVSVLLFIKRRFKLRFLFLLALTFAINSFAWFIYANKVEGGVNAKVKAWNVLFEVGEGEAIQYINFDIDDIYPGMDTFSQDVRITNKGDTSATLSYEIVSVNILGNYIEADPNGTITPELLLHSIRTDYPFKINPSFSNVEVLPKQSETFNLSVSWAFESGDDDEDTYWGSKAYDFSISNPDDPSIQIKMKIMAIQNNS